MKRIFAGLFSLLIGIIMYLPAAAPAQADSGTINADMAARIQSLMIKVSNTVEMGQPFTITVLSRRSQETIAGAPVYAIKTSNRVGTTDPGNYTTLAIEFEAQLESDGILIGTSGSDGTVSATLSEPGRYLLVATGDGFIPGFARTQVKQGSSSARLVLQAPTSSAVGQQVTIKVTYGVSGQAAENATVSAFRTANPLPRIIKPAPAPIENGTATQMIIPQQAPVIIDTEQEDALAGRLGKREIILGSSNSAGEVNYTFNDPGTYMLLVRKPGYLPGARRINIQPDTALKSLKIKTVQNMTIGQITSIQVIERTSGQPVAGAAVYSLSVENNREIKPMPPTANNFKSTIVRSLNDADRVREKGVLIGNTDSAGQVSYSSPSSGPYLLAAFKDGFAPAFVKVNILLAATSTSIPIPQVTTTTAIE